jgi:uncharacterized protein (TIRG00374 family)
MNKYLPWLLRLLGPALLIYVLFFSGLQWAELGATLSGANMWLVLLSLLLMAPFIWIKSWRWTRILRELHISLPLNTAAGIYTVGLFLGGTTPGQAGDFAKGFYLRDRGAALAPAMLSVVLDRLCDLLVMAVLAALSVFAFSSLLPNQALQTALVLATGGGLLLATWMLLAQGPREWLLGSLLPRVLPGRLRATLDRWREQFSSLSLRPPLIAVMVVSSLISASFTFLRLWLLFQALDLVNVPLLTVVAVSALIAVLQVLPISIGGVGVRDAVLVAALAVYGYGTEKAVSLSLLFLLLNIEHIIVGFIVSFWFPLGRAQSQSAERRAQSAERRA